MSRDQKGDLWLHAHRRRSGTGTGRDFLKISTDVPDEPSPDTKAWEQGNTALLLNVEQFTMAKKNLKY